MTSEKSPDCPTCNGARWTGRGVCRTCHGHGPVSAADRAVEFLEAVKHSLDLIQGLLEEGAYTLDEREWLDSRLEAVNKALDTIQQERARALN